MSMYLTYNSENSFCILLIVRPPTSLHSNEDGKRTCTCNDCCNDILISFGIIALCLEYFQFYFLIWAVSSV